MRKGLDMVICSCGRIHFYSNSLLEKIIEDEKELVIVCSRCGDAIHIGANKETNVLIESEDDPKFVYSMYQHVEKNEVITKESFNKRLNDGKGKATIGQVIIDEGTGVPMETGFYASYRTSEGFADYNSQFEVTKPYDSAEAIIADMKAYDERRHKVNMNRLISLLDDEQCDVLSKYCIKNLDWTGTKWERT